MSKGDDMRWRDWRTNRRNELRPSRSCSRCGDQFIPSVVRQTECLRCVETRRVEERASDRLAKRAKDVAAIAQAESVDRKRVGSQISVTEVRGEQSPDRRGGRRGEKGSGNRDISRQRTRGVGGRTNKKQIRHLVERKLREGWRIRKIAKHLDRPIAEIEEIADEIREKA
jgi:hypothetical protein